MPIKKIPSTITATILVGVALLAVALVGDNPTKGQQEKTHREAMIDVSGSQDYGSLASESWAERLLDPSLPSLHTSNWNEYRNEVSGFAIMYPSSWIVREDKHPRTGEAVLYFEEDTPTLPLSARIHLILSVLDDPEVSIRRVVSSAPSIEFNGYKGTLLRGDIDNGELLLYLGLPTDDRIYAFNGGLAFPGHHKGLHDVIELILESFKILDNASE